MRRGVLVCTASAAACYEVTGGVSDVKASVIVFDIVPHSLCTDWVLHR